MVDADVSSVKPMGAGRYALWVAWIAACLVMAYYLGHPDVFFYQGF